VSCTLTPLADCLLRGGKRTPRTLGSGLWALDSGLWALGSQLSALGSVALGSWLLALGSRFSVLGSRLSDGVGLMRGAGHP
jgi:hypothetical protein